MQASVLTLVHPIFDFPPERTVFGFATSIVRGFGPDGGVLVAVGGVLVTGRGGALMHAPAWHPLAHIWIGVSTHCELRA